MLMTTTIEKKPSRTMAEISAEATKRHIKEAASVNLRIVGEASEAILNKRWEYKSYQCDYCEEIQDLKVIHVRTNDFCCSGCDIRDAKNQPSNVYLADITVPEIEFLKIGSSGNLKTRFSKMGLPAKNYKVDVLATIPTASPIAAQALEKSIQNYYSDDNLCHQTMKTLLRHSGNTECFDISIAAKAKRAMSIYNTQEINREHLDALIYKDGGVQIEMDL
jgi:hypothetical protein